MGFRVARQRSVEFTLCFVATRQKAEATMWPHPSHFVRRSEARRRYTLARPVATGPPSSPETERQSHPARTISAISATRAAVERKDFIELKSLGRLWRRKLFVDGNVTKPFAKTATIVKCDESLITKKETSAIVNFIVFLRRDVPTKTGS